VTVRYLVADVFDGLATIDDGSVDVCISSPPFLALRSYLPSDHPDKAKEIGSEATPAEFIDVLLKVTAELRRVLAPHGSIAIELGDTYAGSGGAGGDYADDGWREGQPVYAQRSAGDSRRGADARNLANNSRGTKAGGDWPLAKSKTLIPELYRIALAYGFNPLTGQPSPAGQWRIRNVVTWCRPNPPVGALGDKWRPATSDVVVACLSGKRYWDDLATRKDTPRVERPRLRQGEPAMGRDGNWDSFPNVEVTGGAPLLDYWEIPPGGYKGSHYAVFPPELVVSLVKAMTPEKVCRTCGQPSRRIAHGSSASRRLIPEVVVKAREAKSLSRQALASALGVGANNVWDWEVGGHLPPWEMWQKVKVVLDLIDDLDDAFPPDDAYEQVPLDKERPVKALIAPNEVNPAGRLGGFAYNRTIKTPREFGWTDCGHDDYRPGLVLDPFAGSGTTLMVAHGHGHDSIGIDLDERNLELARERVGPFFFDEVTV
jgi:hypothetical protein